MASVHKRNVETRKPWEVRYKIGGLHKSKSFALKKDADRFRVKIESDLLEGRDLAPMRQMTVAKMCHEYLKSAELRVRDGRIGAGRYSTLRMAVDISIVPLLGPKHIADLSVEDVERFYAGMVATGRLAPMTARGRVSILKLVEEFAKRRGATRGGVVADAMVSFRGIAKPRVRTFTRVQMRSLVTAVETRPATQRRRVFAMMRCAFYLAAQCGLRWGEIFGLTAEHVDLQTRVVRIRHSLTALDDLKGPKTAAGNRDVPISLMIAVALSGWVRDFYVPNDRGLLFRTPTGGPVGSPNFHRYMWRPLLDRAGLMDPRDLFHFHALRHFAASLMIETGQSLPDVASLLGHSTFDMTLQVYAHPISGGSQRHEAIERMAAAFMPPSIERLPAPTQV